MNNNQLATVAYGAVLGWMLCDYVRRLERRLSSLEAPAWRWPAPEHERTTADDTDGTAGAAQH